MAKIVAMLLAGGQGSRLSILAQRRAKPAVPFGGAYRIIDFTLTNIMHAQIPYVGILTQYKPHSLSEHIGSGEWWGFTGRNRAARVLPPYQGNEGSDWYAGTADAIWQNRDFITRYDPDLVVILSGDHIYKMDYKEMIRLHRDRRADVTLAVQQVPWEETPRFGLVQLGDEGRVVRFQEKPKSDPVSNLASLGIYVFNTDVLLRRLEEDASRPDSSKDFGKDVLPAMLSQDRMYGYEFAGYWRDVGTLDSFWQANLEALDPGSGLDLARWGLRTSTYDARAGNYQPARICGDAQVRSSSIARGCVVEGSVEHSILFPGVRVGRGACIRDSIVMSNTLIGEDAVLEKTIVDKEVRIDRGCIVGQGENIINRAHPHLLDTGITVVGEKVSLPRGTRVGRNVLLFPSVGAADLRGSEIAGGETIEPRVESPAQGWS